MGLCGVGESHAPDAFAAVLNPTTDTHLSATRIHNDGIMQGAALPSTPPVWVATTRVKNLAALYVVFLSTPPVWVATARTPASQWTRWSFYPRHPCGWRRPGFATQKNRLICFYPRHPCGWRHLTQHIKPCYRWFLSTPPVWVATCCHGCKGSCWHVSIHATRMGGDPCQYT